MRLESANERDGRADGCREHRQNGPQDAADTWSSILAGLCQLAHAKIALVTTIDRPRQRVSVDGSVNIADHYLQSYAMHHGMFGPPITGAADSGAVWTATDDDAYDADGASGFVAGWLRPQGIAHVICGLLAAQESQATYLTIGRPREAGAYSDADIALIASLLPCIRVAFRSLQLMEGVHDEQQTLLSLLDRLPTGVALLDQRGVPVFMNDYARRALADVGELDSLLPQPGRQQQHEGKAGEAAPGSCVHVIPRPPGSRPLSIIVQRLPAEDAGPARGRPAFALIVSDPNRTIELDHATLCRIYGLTPAEGRLAALLASGKHIESAAHLLGVSIHTVRTHLKHIFSKTETSSQSDLVRLILSAPAPVRTTP
jgi:DNA-binding CsgD family transcriptional regulator